MQSNHQIIINTHCISTLSQTHHVILNFSNLISHGLLQMIIKLLLFSSILSSGTFIASATTEEEISLVCQDLDVLKYVENMYKIEKASPGSFCAAEDCSPKNATYIGCLCYGDRVWSCKELCETDPETCYSLVCGDKPTDGSSNLTIEMILSNRNELFPQIAGLEQRCTSTVTPPILPSNHMTQSAQNMSNSSMTPLCISPEQAAQANVTNQTPVCSTSEISSTERPGTDNATMLTIVLSVVGGVVLLSIITIVIKRKRRKRNRNRREEGPERRGYLERELMNGGDNGADQEVRNTSLFPNLWRKIRARLH